MNSHKTFQAALDDWRESGGALNYVHAMPGETSGSWQVWQSLSGLEDAVECSPREATEEALRCGGMTEDQIAEEMKDWYDN